MKNNPFVGKSTRTKIFTVISVVAILLLLVLNIWLSKFGIFGNAYIDLTPEGLYTLSPEMERACEDVFYMSDGSLRDPGIKITFCNDPDNIIDEMSTRVVYYMAIAMSKRFDNCEVETVNVNIDPTTVAQYKTTSLTQITDRDIIISYGSRYRIVSADNFWRVMSDKTVYSYDGEYQMMTYMLSLTLIDRPVAYFVTDHGETYYDVSNAENPMNSETGVFVDLLHDRGFEVKNLSISKLIEDAEVKSAESGKKVTPEIPEDCVLLIINNPTEDFRYDENKATSISYISETEILDRYMTDERGSIMVSVDYDAVGRNEKKLGNLEDFLAEWGIECTGLKVTDSVNGVANLKGDNSTLIADYEVDENSYAGQVYGDFATMSSAPRFVIDNTGSLKTAFGLGESANEPGSSQTVRVFTPFLYTSADSLSYAKGQTGEYSDLAAEGKQVVAALGSRKTTNSTSGTDTFSYVFCSASPVFFSSEYLGNTSFANFDIVSALVQNICRLDTFADDSLGGQSYNGTKFLGKQLVDTAIRAEDTSEEIFVNDDGGKEVVVSYGLTASRRNWMVALIVAIPLAIAVAGIVVCIRRKYL